MSLAPGTRLGPYEVTAPIGSGGMGEVYLATDTHLKRRVAVKVLPESFADDPERLARFQREAEILASLNHPHIAQIHGLERHGATTAIVMELVEGPTLADRIMAGALPADEALPIARQIAEALEAAHEQGIIHRDLKPANIKVRPDGTVKILDFGLAKAMDPATAVSPDAARSPTITSPAMTERGVILGTAAYMSPEQARGRTVDRRADIWAFGCVLYEMLTGRRAFEGEDVALTLSSVLQREPDWDRLPADLPAPVTAFLRRCLAKDPKQRVRDMGDIRLALDGAFAFAAVPSQQKKQRTILRWQSSAFVASVVIAAVIVTALPAWIFNRRAPAPPPPVTRTSIAVPPDHVITAFGSRVIAISPAGTHVVYVANRQLYVRALDELEARPLAGTEDTAPDDPFFSPDGQWIGFNSTRDRTLQKLALTGGAAVRLASADANGASWAEDDTIVYADTEQGILRVSAAGGKPEVLVPGEPRVRFQQPQVLPGGRALLYTRCTSGGCSNPATWDTAEVVVHDLATGERTVVIQNGADARYLVSGHLVYARGTTLLAVPFDLQGRRTTGGAVPFVAGVSRGGIHGVIQADVSRTGTLVYRAGDADSPSRLVWVDRAGREEVIAAPPRAYYTPSISPDGTRVVLYANDAERDQWVWEFARSTLTRLTASPSTELYAVWEPNGRRIVFNSDIGGTRAIYWRAAEGIGTAELLLDDPEPLWPMSITPDGTRLVYARGERTRFDLHTLTLDRERRTEPLIVTEFDETDADISPDGRWLAYQSNASGQHEVYVQPFPSVGEGRWQVSASGGLAPRWSPDGRELFFMTQAGSLMSVEVTTRGGFAAGVPSLVVKGPYQSGVRSYDVSRDGKRFLMIASAGQTPTPGGPSGIPIVVVQSWFEELKARAPSQ